MKLKTVQSSWLEHDGRRLDCNPYMSGALEARLALNALRAKKQRLYELCSRGSDGIFHAGRETRRWVEDPRAGIRFLGSTDILAADLRGLPLLSRAQVERNPRLLIRKGWTLITRTGTVGRMAYCRSDMDGLACSEHVMRVVPDTERVLPGYLYAYLASKYGVPLVAGGTYGSIIQSIEPQHIEGIAVPRLGDEVEQQSHALVEQAAGLRERANRILARVAERFDALVDGVALNAKRESPRISIVPAQAVQQRLDAQFHDPLVQEIRERLAQGLHTSIGKWCTRIFLPGIFKRIHVDDAAHGAPYYTGATLFWLEPLPKGVLSRRTTLFKQVLMEEDTVLVQAFGQEGGLTGRSVWVGRQLAGSTTTHMLVRLRAETREDTAYLFGFLQSDAAYRQIASLTYGGSIPHFDEAGIASVVMPLLSPSERRRVACEVLDAVTARDDALDAERQARAMIENAIEKGAN